MRWRVVLGNGLAVVLLSLPYLLLGLEATRSGFLSNDHAYLIEKALMVRDRGRLEWIGFAYPPLPVGLLLPWPSPYGAVALSSLCAGALAWGVWRSMGRLDFHPAVRAGLLLAVMVVPSSLFQATQSLSATLGLLLFFAAWIQYLLLTRGERTDAGFIAALLISLGFLANFYAPFFAIAFALTVPLFARLRSRAHLGAIMLILIFPSLAIVGSWAYLSWLFTGDPLRFVFDPSSSLLAAFLPDEAFLTADAIARESVRRLLATPLYLGVGILIARYQLRRLPAYLIPVALDLSAWSMGWAVPQPFDQSLRLLFAISGIPARTPRRLGGLLLLLASLHVVADGSVLAFGEPARWWRALNAGPLPEDQVEQRVAQHLARLPCGSVLTDDREAFRLIARAGTACPFVLPPDPIFEMAVVAPERFVSYVFVAEHPTRLPGPLEARYRDRPPKGFVTELSWPGWRLYRRIVSEKTDLY
ncbi:MAG TPA: hypothetical protein VNK89_00960 [Thermoflexus sp.]|nr:hypothetical protein [Thermoflexus sp.]